MESMHRKTFFQAATSVSSRDPLSHQMLNGSLVPGLVHIGDYSKMAEKMLRKCGVTRERHCRAGSMLRQGAGRLSTEAGGSTRSTARRLKLRTELAG